MTSFFEAIAANNSVRVKELIERDNIDVDKYILINGNSFCPIYYAIKNSFISLTNVLLEHGANINTCRAYYSVGDFSSLMLSVYLNSLKIAKLILSHNANANLKNVHNETALYIAAKRNNLEAVKLLLSLQDIDCNVKADEGLFAHEVTNDELIRKLIIMRKNEMENNRLRMEVRELIFVKINKKIKDAQAELKSLDTSIVDLTDKISAMIDDLNEKRLRFSAVEIELQEFLCEKAEKEKDNTVFALIDEKLLECPLCFEVPYPPRKTLQCRNGHTVCSRCRDHPLENCPQCRVALDDVQEVRIIERIVNEKTQPNTYGLKN